MKSIKEMAESTPRRSLRLPHTHTPKMSERRKGLFQVELETPQDTLTKHRRLSVVDSESDSDDCDLGIISTLDSSSGEETDQNRRTPERVLWRGSRSHSKKLIESQGLKNFMKSPFTLKKYQTRHCPETRCMGSLSTPATPHLQNHPGTPSSTHSCASAHTTSSTSSRARKSLASLIADTESCSSSLKDLNFDTDSGTDSKENTPTRSIRRSSRIHKLTPKFQSFKGILVEQKKNITPMKNAVVCLTKMDMSSISPTQMQKTPHNTSETKSPPKIGHNRRSIVEIQESPESTFDSEKSYKRFHDDTWDSAPNSKYPRLEPHTAPKARLSLFNCERLKEILSAKSFYGKSNPDLNTSVTTKLCHAIEATATHHRRPFANSHSHRRKRRPGEINMGVKHKIRKPKIQKHKLNNVRGNSAFNKPNNSLLNNSTISNVSTNKDASMLSQNSSQELLNVSEKADPFDKEKQTIEALLSQWTEEEVPESELIYSKSSRNELPCFSSTIIEETNQIFQPVTAVPVAPQTVPPESESVIIELGTPQNATSLLSNSLPMQQNIVQMPQHADQLQSVQQNPQNTIELPKSSPTSDVMMVDSEGHASTHGEIPKNGHFLPVEGGYILVDGTVVPHQEEIPDLDEIERELQMLDEQILKMAQNNNINAEAVLASTETISTVEGSTSAATEAEKPEKSQKLFPIFSNPNPGISTLSSTPKDKEKKMILKTANDQYVIDAGQKRFGVTQCNDCGVIYQIGDPQDEHAHSVYHNASDVLRFNGWKEECVVDRTDTGRCIRVRGCEAGWKKVEALLSRVVHPSLGYDAELPEDPRTYTAYLYIEKKKIVGCLIVEPKVRAFKMLPGDPDCCSVENYPVKLGVSRVWTHARHRRRGLAARLLRCARASALPSGAVHVHELAFSAPTPAGKAFATSVCGTPNFYVYL